MVDKRKGYNLTKALCIGEGLTRWLIIKDTVGYNNPTVDMAIHSGAEVSIDTQSEEERMQMQQIMDSSE